MNILRLSSHLQLHCRVCHYGILVHKFHLSVCLDYLLKLLLPEALFPKCKCLFHFTELGNTAQRVMLYNPTERLNM